MFGKKNSSTRLRWRIMIGIGTDRDGEKISTTWARETAINIADVLEAYSITDGIGAWHGKQEPSLVIEYIGEEGERDRIDAIADCIRRYLNQEEVWVSEEPITLTRFTS